MRFTGAGSSGSIHPARFIRIMGQHRFEPDSNPKQSSPYAGEGDQPTLISQGRWCCRPEAGEDGWPFRVRMDGWPMKTRWLAVGRAGLPAAPSLLGWRVENRPWAGVAMRRPKLYNELTRANSKERANDKGDLDAN